VSNQRLGRQGELRALEFLGKNGYLVLERNYRCCFGEIDIIARDKECVSFIEVKSRSSDKFGNPSEAVTAGKQLQIEKVALDYLKKRKLLDVSARFDVIEVFFEQDSAKVRLIKNAFELSQRFSL
jgi:putative endonuclease